MDWTCHVHANGASDKTKSGAGLLHHNPLQASARPLSQTSLTTTGPNAEIIAAERAILQPRRRTASLVGSPVHITSPAARTTNSFPSYPLCVCHIACVPRNVPIRLHRSTEPDTKTRDNHHASHHHLRRRNGSSNKTFTMPAVSGQDHVHILQERDWQQTVGQSGMTPTAFSFLIPVFVVAIVAPL